MHLFGHAGRNITRQTDLSSESDFGRSPVGCNQANQHVEAQGNHKSTHGATNNTLSATPKPSTNILDSAVEIVSWCRCRSASPSTCTGDTFLQVRHVFNPVQGAVLDGTGRSLFGCWDLWCIRRGTFSQAAPALV
jgi:hypothetical protein